MKMRQRVSIILACTILFLINTPPLLTQQPTGEQTAQLTATGPPAEWPQPIPGGLTPTISLSRGSGYAGETIIVSGQGVAGQPGVRIAWVFDDVTLNLTQAVVENGNAYSATIDVPIEASPGAAQICAAVTGSPLAQFACVPFEIEAPPPGAIQGQLPLEYLPRAVDNNQLSGASEGAFNTRFLLLDRSGQTMASAPIAADGRFSLANVSPGLYQTAIVGDLVRPIATAPAKVEPGGLLDLLDDGNWIANIPCTSVAVQASVSAMGANPSYGQGRPGLLDATQSALLRATYQPDYDFGAYLAGVSLDVTFSAQVQEKPGVAVQGVTFELVKSGTRIPLGNGTKVGDTWQVTFNMANVTKPGRYYLYARPQVPAPYIGCQGTRAVEVLADPMKDDRFQSPGANTFWNGTAYQFSGLIPNVTIDGVSLLPARYDTPKLPYLGMLRNSLSAGVRINGTLNLEGLVRISLVRAEAEAILVNQTILHPNWFNYPFPIPPDASPHANLRDLPIRLGHHTIYHFYEEAPVYGGPLVTFFGIVSIAGSINIGMGGDVTIEATLFPFRPALDSTLTAKADQSLTLSLMLDLLAGVADVGADARMEMAESLPLHLNIGPNPEVDLNACLLVRLSVRAWVSYLWGLGSDSASKVLIDENPCLLPPPDSQLTNLENEAGDMPPGPRVIASPAIAIAENGTRLAVYVADESPTAATPSPRLLARFWDSGTNDWGPPTPLSNPAHTVHSPVAAFFGPTNTAVVVWVENVLSQNEAVALGKDLLAHIQHQEIFYATWDGTTWSAPVRLTDDDLPDGRPTVAGDLNGFSLAWVRDVPGGSAAARRHIAARSWNVTSGAWTPLQLLDASSSAAVIPYTSQPPTLDGACDAAGEYQNGQHLIYNEPDGETGRVYTLHDSDYLYVCVQGAAGTNPGRWTAVQLDTDNGQETWAQTEDLTLGAGIEQGNLAAAQGSGSGGYTPTTVPGWTATVSATGSADVAEFRIPLAVTGGGCNAPFGLSVFHYHVNSPGDDWGWPNQQGWDRPESWAEVMLECAGQGMNAQPSITRRPATNCLAGDCSQIVLAWTADQDRDITTNADRTLYFMITQLGGLSTDGPGGYSNSIFNHSGIPAGVDSPSLTLYPSDTTLVYTTFLVRGKDGDGLTDTSIGNNAELWAGGFSLTDEFNYAFAPVRENDKPIFAERPQMLIDDDGRPALLYRRFGPIGTYGALGQVTLSQMGDNGQFLEHVYLTDEAQQNWQAAAAVDPQTGEVVSLKVARSTFGDISRLTPAGAGAAPAVMSRALDGGQDAVSSLQLTALADPALDPLIASDLGTAPGQPVTVTITARNVGQGQADGMTVQLYEGTPESGLLLQTIPLAASLEFGQVYSFTLPVTPTSGNFELTALINANTNFSPDNDRVSLTLSALLPPTALNVGESNRYRDAADVSWFSASASASGYRVLRSTDDGPYEFVGEALGVSYTDALLQRGHTYCYQVQAYDSAGNLSALTESACMRFDLLQVFLPLVWK